MTKFLITRKSCTDKSGINRNRMRSRMRAELTKTEGKGERGQMQNVSERVLGKDQILI
jgi:hypothetical protein